MFSPRFSFLTLALLVCGFQANQVKASQAKVKQSAEAEPVSKPFFDLKKQITATLESFANATDTATAKAEFENITRLESDLNTELDMHADDTDRASIQEALKDVKQSIISQLQRAEETFSSDAPFVEVLRENRRNRETALVTEFASSLKNLNDEAAIRPLSLTKLKALKGRCANLLQRVQKAMLTDKNKKDSYVKALTDLITEINIRIADTEKNGKETTTAPVVTATPATPGYNKTKWLVAGALAFTAAMTYGEVRHKMLTKMFTQMTKFLTPLATRMGLVKVEKVVVPQLSWWGWFLKKAVFWR